MTHKITCKEDLYNTYIRCSEDNNKAIIAKCKEFGIPVFTSYALDVIDFGIFEVCDEYNNGFMKLWLCWGEDDLNDGSVEITLEDLLGTTGDAVEETADDPLPPQTFKKDGFTYTTINELDLEDVDLAKMFANGELYKADGVQITTLKMLNNTDYEVIYTREKLNWWDTCTFPVLCWVSDYFAADSQNDVGCVLSFDAKENYPFQTQGNEWAYATPLTKEEIQVYLDNAPE